MTLSDRFTFTRPCAQASFTGDVHPMYAQDDVPADDELDEDIDDEDEDEEKDEDDDEDDDDEDEEDDEGEEEEAEAGTH